MSAKASSRLEKTRKLGAEESPTTVNSSSIRGKCPSHPEPA